MPDTLITPAFLLVSSDFAAALDMLILSRTIEYKHNLSNFEHHLPCLCAIDSFELSSRFHFKLELEYSSARRLGW